MRVKIIVVILMLLLLPLAVSADTNVTLGVTTEGGDANFHTRDIQLCGFYDRVN